MSHSRLYNAIYDLIPDGASVLDVGSGFAAYHDLILERCSELVLIDAHLPYLMRANTQATHIHGDAVTLLPAMREPSDIILGIDFIEHLERLDAEKVIGEMKRLAKKCVGLFVPEGIHPQTADHFGLGGDHWQTHRSSWRADDLIAMGFHVEVWGDFHAGTPGKDPGALWAVWRKNGKA